MEIRPWTPMGILPFILGQLESIPGTFVQEYLLPVFHEPVQDPRQLGSAGDDSGINYEWVSGYTYPATSGDARKDITATTPLAT